MPVPRPVTVDFGGEVSEALFGGLITSSWRCGDRRVRGAFVTGDCLVISPVVSVDIAEVQNKRNDPPEVFVQHLDNQTIITTDESLLQPVDLDGLIATRRAWATGLSLPSAVRGDEIIPKLVQVN